MTGNKSIDNVIGEIPKNLTEIEKIRYIYLKLGKFFIYNIGYFVGEEDKQVMLYNRKIDLKNIYTRRTVCSQVAYALSETINNNVENVKASTMRRSIIGRPRKIEHIATKLETSNGEKYILDLTLDLYRIQNNLQTKEFGFASYVDDDYDIIPLRQVREIDNKIGYTQNGIYMNEFVARMAKEMTNIELIKEYVIGNGIKDVDKDKILRYKIDFVLKNLDVKKSGPIEAKDYVLYVLESVLLPEESQRVKQFNLYNKKDGYTKMDIALRVICGDDRFYYLRKEEGNFKKVELQDILGLMRNDWFIKSATIQNETRNEGFTL